MSEEGREGRPPQRAEARSTELGLGRRLQKKKKIIFGVFMRLRMVSNARTSGQVDAEIGQRSPLFLHRFPRNKQFLACFAQKFRKDQAICVPLQLNR